MAQKIDCLENLTASYETKLEDLKIASTVHKIMTDTEEDPDQLSILDKINGKIRNLTYLHSEIRSKCRSWQHDIGTLKELASQLETLTEHTSYVYNNIPPELQVTLPDSSKTVNKPSLSADKENKQPATSGIPVKASAVAKKPKLKHPSVEHITGEEFKSVSSYMKGRIILDEANKTIDTLNVTVSEKHRVVMTKRSTLNSNERSVLDKYRLQNNPECQGLFFVTDDDIKCFSHVKLDKKFRNIMSILRHCGRIKEIHGGNVTRYVILR